MGQDRKDRRVIKTRRAIHMAFAELVSTKDVKDITIRDIAELADINRKTFYNHYRDINELIDDIENEIIAAFDEAMEGIDLMGVLDDPEEICNRLLSIGYRTQDICAHLMKIEYDGHMVSKISEALISSILKNSRGQILIDDKTFRLLMEFAVAGMLQTYQNWFNSDRSEPIEELSLKLSYLIIKGFSGMLPEEMEYTSES